ncbi:MAG: ATP-grasp domain-containing protein [Nanoarchaeota archaeon]
MEKRALIYHTDLAEDALPDTKDVLDEVKYVSDGLTSLGYEVIQLPFKFNNEGYEENLTYIQGETSEINPNFIFNLVEEAKGPDGVLTDRLAYLATEVFEDLRIPYTGCTLNAFLRTQTKIEAKRLFIVNGIPTPDFFTLENLEQFLIKPNNENASKGIDGKVYSGKNFFAEEYIEGREFNVSCMGPLKDCNVLPIPEMKFIDWPEDKPKIVGYDAKWNPNSEEYKRTKRSFEISDSDRELMDNLRDITKKCWDVFDLRGWARVDFRVDKNGKPYVLEINANPGIDPTSGFVWATKEAGISWEQVLEKIIRDSCGIVA